MKGTADVFYMLTLEMVTHTAEGVFPRSVSLLIWVEDIVRIKRSLDSTEMSDHLHTELLLKPWPADQSIVVLTR